MTMKRQNGFPNALIHNTRILLGRWKPNDSAKGCAFLQSSMVPVYLVYFVTIKHVLRTYYRCAKYWQVIYNLIKCFSILGVTIHHTYENLWNLICMFLLIRIYMMFSPLLFKTELCPALLASSVLLFQFRRLGEILILG